MSWRHLSISGISQLLLIRFSPNFKGRIFGPCLKDANCYGDICPGNICPGDICPYKQYLSCYWSDFDQTFWTQFFWSHNFCGPKCSWTKLFQDSKFYQGPKFLDQKFYWTRKKFHLKFSCTQNCLRPAIFA